MHLDTVAHFGEPDTFRVVYFTSSGKVRPVLSEKENSNGGIYFNRVYEYQGRAIYRNIPKDKPSSIFGSISFKLKNIKI